MNVHDSHSASVSRAGILLGGQRFRASDCAEMGGRPCRISSHIETCCFFVPLSHPVVCACRRDVVATIATGCVTTGRSEQTRPWLVEQPRSRSHDCRRNHGRERVDAMAVCATTSNKRLARTWPDGQGRGRGSFQYCCQVDAKTGCATSAAAGSRPRPAARPPAANSSRGRGRLDEVVDRIMPKLRLRQRCFQLRNHESQVPSPKQRRR